MDVYAEILLKDDAMADDLCSRLNRGDYRPIELAKRFICRTKTDRVFTRCEISQWAHMHSRLERDGFRVIASSFGEEEIDEVPFDFLMIVCRAEAVGDKSVESYFTGLAKGKEKKKGK